ncbi:hypothetical protein ATCC90586_007200 [Pythium insidiosum]|nr:hypothetical protein ATCC90586_007200 [Pythium insidiosum]
MASLRVLFLSVAALAAAVEMATADFVYVAAKCRDVRFSLPGGGKVDLTCTDDAGVNLTDAMLREESSDRHEVFLKFSSETTAKRRLTIGKCIDPQVTKLTVNGYGDTTVAFLPDALNGLTSLSLLALGQLDPKDANIKLQVSAKLSYLYGRGTKFPSLPTFLFERKYKSMKLSVPTPSTAIKRLSQVEFANAQANFAQYIDAGNNIANVTNEYKGSKVVTLIKFSNDCKDAEPNLRNNTLVVCQDTSQTTSLLLSPKPTQPKDGSQPRADVVGDAAVKQSSAVCPLSAAAVAWMVIAGAFQSLFF